MARPRNEIRGEVQQAVKEYIDHLICEGTAQGTGCAIDRNQMKPCHEQRRPIESRAARIPDYMNCAGCAPAGYTYPPAAPRRHHWIEFRANGSPEPPRVPSPPAPRSCGYYCPRESMLADCVKPVCPEKTFNSGQCYTPSDYAWMDVPNPYLQPNTGLYQAPRNTTYQRDYFGPDKGNADYLPALDEWMRKASTEEREAAVAIMKQRGGGYGGGHGGDNNQRCGLDRTAIRCPTRPLGATRSRLPGALRFPHQPTAGVVTGLPEWAAANPIVKLQQQRLLEAVQKANHNAMAREEQKDLENCSAT